MWDYAVTANWAEGQETEAVLHETRHHKRKKYAVVVYTLLFGEQKKNGRKIGGAFCHRAKLMRKWPSIKVILRHNLLRLYSVKFFSFRHKYL